MTRQAFAVVIGTVALIMGFYQYLSMDLLKIDRKILGERSRRKRNGVKRPNFVLLTAEDMSSKVRCFGDSAAHTPFLDELSKEGVRFTNVHVTAPVCAPSRSTLWTGFHQNTLGTQNMRTAQPKLAQKLGESNGWLYDYEAVIPDGIRSFTETLRQNGYFVINAGSPVPKTDYQFGDMDDTMWDLQGGRASWRDRPSSDTPFFFYWNALVTHESGLFKPFSEPLTQVVSSRKAMLLAIFDMIVCVVRWWEGDDQPTQASDVRVPPYYPDTITFREQIARQYNNIAIMDKQVGRILAQLREDGLWDDTVIIWTTDHGDGLPRGKRFCYDSGSRVPFIYKSAENFHQSSHPGSTSSDELVSFVDIAPTILHLAGLPDEAARLPGRVFIGNIGLAGLERDAVFCATDRFDENHDMKSRSVRNAKWKLIHNLAPGTPYLTPLPYRDRLPCMREWKALSDAGQLASHNKTAWEDKPEWELYQLDTDPDEINNVFAQHVGIAKDLQIRLANHLESTDDLGMTLSELEMYNRMYPGGRQPTCKAPAIKQCPGATDTNNTLCIKAAENHTSMLFRWRLPAMFLGKPMFFKNSAWRLLPHEHVEEIQTAHLCSSLAASSSGFHVVLEAKATRYGYKDSSIVFHKITC